MYYLSYFLYPRFLSETSVVSCPQFVFHSHVLELTPRHYSHTAILPKFSYFLTGSIFPGKLVTSVFPLDISAFVHCLAWWVKLGPKYFCPEFFPSSSWMTCGKWRLVNNSNARMRKEMHLCAKDFMSRHLFLAVKSPVPRNWITSENLKRNTYTTLT